MNLINDKWLPIIREDGSKERIAPWQIAEQDNPVIEIDAPRADFNGALYQLLIGLLQSSCAADDEDDWEDVWNDGISVTELKAKFEGLMDAFELTPNNDADSPAAFMQDFDLPESEAKPISALLIEAPGAKTIKDNLDHFVKRGQVNSVCSSCAATALFTLQINAPSGGAGHRVGLRGGGPLTTLVLPDNDSNNSLWRKLWLNVLNKEHLKRADYSCNSTQFPWLAPTKTSEKKGSEIMPEQTNPMQMYWAMPRRIRLIKSAEILPCDLCGGSDKASFTEYCTKNYGANYEGEWLHPLTPYWFDPKKQKAPLSLKGQKGGLNYSNWLGITLQYEENKGNRSAEIVRVYMDERAKVIGGHKTARLWCFGFDMDNMKARCWYEHQFPMFTLNKAQIDNVLHWAGELILSARETSFILRKYVKEAWFSRPSDVKGDMSYIEASFWQLTEMQFYELLYQLTQFSEDIQFPHLVYQNWLKHLRQSMFSLFDKYTTESPPKDLNMKRIVLAREQLAKKYFGNKLIKEMTQRSQVIIENEQKEVT